MDENDQAVAPDSPPAPVAKPSLEAEIETWFRDHFHNSVVSRETEIYNLVLAAKQDLIKRFTAL